MGIACRVSHHYFLGYAYRGGEYAHASVGAVWILCVGLLGTIAWLGYESRRLGQIYRTEYEFELAQSEPSLRAIQQAIANIPEEHVRWETFARPFTEHYRENQIPIRVRAVPKMDGTLEMRLYSGVSLPRWYTARIARTLWQEANACLKAQAPIAIYETNVVGRSRLIGVCQQSGDGAIEVQMVR